MNKLKILFLETRPHFLLLTPVCVFLGIAAAVYHGYFNPIHAVLVLVGSTFAHASVNVFNDYYDYVRGTDLLTKRTPFSGGSGFLPAGIIKPKEALALAIALLLSASIIRSILYLQLPNFITNSSSWNLSYLCVYTVTYEGSNN